MNDESKAALIEHLKTDAYNGKTIEQAHTFFHSPQASEVTAMQPKPVTSVALFSLLSKQSRAAVGDWANLPLLTSNLERQNREGIGMLLTMLFDAGKITADEYSKAMPLLQATEQITTTVIEDAPIVSVLNPVADAGRPNVIAFDEFNECFQIARG